SRRRHTRSYGDWSSDVCSSDLLTELNHALSLEEATLRDPGRIDRIARTLGLQSPQAGQVVRIDSSAPESSGQVVASLTPVAVIRSEERRVGKEGGCRMWT